ncbi:MAG: Flp pilus assembly protein CpaB [Actinomycetota bacterium]|nr:MAG: Flp pilus assembly protein CpaB [Actinomycetota bacterium]
MGRRTLLLVAALLIAGIGTALVFLYVNNREDQAKAQTTPVPVLVAVKRVEVGTTAAAAQAAGAFEQRMYPQAAVPQGALADLSSVDGRVAQVTILPGQVVQSAMWGTSAVGGLPIPQGKQAITLTLPEAQRVGGFVVPGSEVTVYYTVPGAGSASPTTMVLIPQATVLAVGSSTVTSGGTGGGSAQVTLAVDQDQAQKLIFTGTGQGGTSLYLTLRGPSAQALPGLRTTTNNLAS